MGIRLKWKIILLLISGLNFGCRHKDKQCFVDGVYSANPIFSNVIYGDHLLLKIKNGVVLLESSEGARYQAGFIDDNEWCLWDGETTIISRSDQGIVVQVVGRDSFIELPEVSDDKNVQYSESSIRTYEVSDLLSICGNSPTINGEENVKWKYLRDWASHSHNTALPIYLNNAFSLEASIIRSNICLTLNYLCEDSFGIVFDPDSFVGTFIVIESESTAEIVHMKPTGHARYVDLEPFQKFEYEIPLVDVGIEKIFSNLNSLHVFADLSIDMPPYSVQSGRSEIRHDAYEDQNGVSANIETKSVEREEKQ